MKKWIKTLGCLCAVVWFGVSYADDDDMATSPAQLYFKSAGKMPGNFYLTSGGAYSLQALKLSALADQLPLTISRKKMSTGLAFVELGYRLDPNYAKSFRFSVSGLYRPTRRFSIIPYTASDDSQFARVDITTTQVMGNIYYDFVSKDKDSVLRSLNVTPFIGVGLGWARNQGGMEIKNLVGHQVTQARQSGVTNQLAWDVVVGSSAEIYRQLDVMSFVRFSSLGRSKFNAAPNQALAEGRYFYSLDIGLGFRYNFI